LLLPLLANAMPCRVHNCGLFGDACRAARHSSTALSNSLARNAELMGSMGFAVVWGRTSEGQTGKAKATTITMLKKWFGGAAGAKARPVLQRLGGGPSRFRIN